MLTRARELVREDIAQLEQRVDELNQFSDSE